MKPMILADSGDRESCDLQKCLISQSPASNGSKSSKEAFSPLLNSHHRSCAHCLSFQKDVPFRNSTGKNPPSPAALLPQPSHHKRGRPHQPVSPSRHLGKTGHTEGRPWKMQSFLLMLAPSWVFLGLWLRVMVKSSGSILIGRILFWYGKCITMCICFFLRPCSLPHTSIIY